MILGGAILGGALALGYVYFNREAEVTTRACLVKENLDIRGVVIGQAPYQVAFRSNAGNASIGSAIEGQNLYVRADGFPSDSVLVIANPHPVPLNTGDTIDTKVVGWRSGTQTGEGPCTPRSLMPYTTPSQLVRFTTDSTYKPIGQDSAIANVVRNGNIVRQHKD